MNLLNLDEIVSKADQLSVQIGGITYQVAEVTLKDTVKALQAQEMKSDGTEEGDVKIIEALVGHAQTYLPECPEEVLYALNQEKILALVNWISEQLTGDEAKEETAGDDDEKGGKKLKK